MRRTIRATTAALLVFSLACDEKEKKPVITEPQTGDGFLTQLGLGAVSDRYTAEVWVRGTTGYTTTWGTRGVAVGNAVKIWDVSGNTPILVDSVRVLNATTLGDVQVSDDGSLLVVAVEHSPHGGLALFPLRILASRS